LSNELSEDMDLGKARTVKTKRVADMLLAKYPDKFTTDFEENKKIVSGLVSIPSRQLRNEVAGHLAAFMNAKQKQMPEA
jgi:small subunit ribosomal protein S17e